MFSGKKDSGGSGSGGGGGGSTGREKSGQWAALQFPAVDPPGSAATELAAPTPRAASLNFCSWVTLHSPMGLISMGALEADMHMASACIDMCQDIMHGVNVRVSLTLN
jgi:hypothetical protein